MVTGIGVDLIEVDRVIRLVKRRISTKVFYREILIIQEDIRKAADNFAVKEAVSNVRNWFSNLYPHY